jgi:hypothetical protein
MTIEDCRKRAEEARQKALRLTHRDRDVWLRLAEEYDRIADRLEQAAKK